MLCAGVNRDAAPHPHGWMGTASPTGKVCLGYMRPSRVWVTRGCSGFPEKGPVFGSRKKQLIASRHDQS